MYTQMLIVEHLLWYHGANLRNYFILKGVGLGNQINNVEKLEFFRITHVNSFGRLLLLFLGAVNNYY